MPVDVWYPGLSAVSNKCFSVCLCPCVLPTSQQVWHLGLSLTLYAPFSFTTCRLLVTSGTRTSQSCCAYLQLRKQKMKLRHDCHRSSSKLNLEKRIIFLLWCFHCRSRGCYKKQKQRQMLSVCSSLVCFILSCSRCNFLYRLFQKIKKRRDLMKSLNAIAKRRTNLATSWWRQKEAFTVVAEEKSKVFFSGFGRDQNEA